MELTWFSRKVDELTITIQFIPKNKNISKISKNPISLPAKLKPHELNQVLNFFLKKKKIFNFSINGELLRTSLIKFVDRRGLSIEKMLYVKYFYANSEPTQETENLHQDWVSDVSLFQSFAATCAYDNSVSLWNGKNLIHSIQKHKDVPKTLTLINQGGLSQRFATGGNDKRIIMWKFNGKKNQLKCIKTWLNNSAICSITSANDVPYLVSGNWNGECNFYPTKITFQNLNKQNQKKKKV